MTPLAKILLLALTLCALTGTAAARQDTDYAADIDYALAELERHCGHFFDLKEIDWKAVSKSFRAEIKKVETDQEHLVLLWRLLARLEDGHAEVRPLEAGKDVKYPEQPEKTGPGMFWCKSGKKILVKNAWNAAKASGVEPGMEVVKVDGLRVADWLDARIAERSDLISFSTPHHAFFNTCHWGLAGEPGTRLSLELKTVKGKKKKRTVTYGRANPVAKGPAFFPPGLESTKDVNYGLMPEGYAYVHVRRCKSTLPTQIDTALAAVHEAPGMILDFRGNSGGGFDHDDFLGRFVPAGKTLGFQKRYASTGTTPYGGPIVVIIDATVRSAGETGSGIFKEDGRAYMIGESPTAGMAASKRTIELPSKLFSLYVSIASNKGRFNGGRGIEGIGVIPHEIVAYEQKDLARQIDTLIARATELLERFPQKKVPYDPADFGWELVR
ncbi:MAG: hypothetical protein GY711_06720 [bacterium]|nr:hypothetical protein [bacterium]